MIKLRVVGTTPDGDALVLSNKPKGKAGSHTVPIDGRLIAVLQGVFDERRPSRAPSRSLPTAVEPPKVPPREIQRMLRAGMTVAQVARAADVDESYVEQFYPPVLYEREGVVREARALYQEKARLGPSGLPLGEAVERNLSQRRVRLEADLDKAWMATRQEGGPWVVSLAFPFRGRTRKATWHFDPRTRSLVAANKLAVDVGWVPNGAKPQPLRAAAMGGLESRARGTQKRAPAKRPASKRAGSKRAPAKRATAKRGARKRPAATRSPAKRKAAATRRATPKRRAPKRNSSTKRRPSPKRPSPKRRPTAKRRATPKRRATLKRRPTARRAPARGRRR